jgi:hypothetical protein
LEGIHFHFRMGFHYWRDYRNRERNEWI